MSGARSSPPPREEALGEAEAASVAGVGLGSAGSTQRAVAVAVEAGKWPETEQLRALAESAVEAIARVFPPPHGGRERFLPNSEVSLLFTDDAAVRVLNRTWRGKDKPTNVLSFSQPAGPLLGDIVLAAETVTREADLANKPVADHIAHLIVHGTLHLLGYDHEEEAEAEAMERLEAAALAEMGLADPYAAARQDS